MTFTAVKSVERVTKGGEYRKLLLNGIIMPFGFNGDAVLMAMENFLATLAKQNRR